MNSINGGHFVCISGVFKQHPAPRLETKSQTGAPSKFSLYYVHKGGLKPPDSHPDITLRYHIQVSHPDITPRYFEHIKTSKKKEKNMA